MIGLSALAALIAASSVKASTVWCGDFSSYSSPSTFDNWSWSNQVGEYQWYIHGSSATSSYLNPGSSYKNPADTAESNGIKLTIDSSSHWNGQTMQRTEIIPQTTANLGSGELFYHFSLSHSTTNPPDFTVEHQVLFFESHFTQFKIGVGPNPTYLQWYAGQNVAWSTPFNAGTWYNFAYDINFSAGTVSLWASIGSDPLKQVTSAIGGSSPSTNSADFHVGVLAFGSAKEDWYISGVYVESGPITTSVTGVCGKSGGSSPPVTTTTAVSNPQTTSKPVSGVTTTTSKVPITTTSTASGATQTKYGQCGGVGWTGPTTCVAGSTCKASNQYYSQCL